jgi:hypothetical protein
VIAPSKGVLDWQVTATCPNYLTFGICPGR